MNHPAFVRRVLALVLTAAVAVAAALPGFAVYAMPIQTAYPQESIYLFDADTGEVLVEQNPDLPRCVASLTKMMTALLVIERGNDLNAEIAIELLRLTHLEVTRAADGEQAVSMLTHSAPGTYDLILMDVQMPNMDGYDATRAIRASGHAQGTSIPIIAMTANAFSEDVKSAMLAGMNAHIAKPIDTHLLYETLQKYLCGGPENAQPDGGTPAGGKP